MSWENIFSIANIWPLLFWLLLVFGPRTEFIARAVLFGGVFPLALTYAVLLPMIMTGAMDPEKLPNAGTISITELSGIMAMFASKGGTLVGWIHYLAFDLLVGLWVARNADQYGISRLVQVPILLFVLMAGPIGLLLYLLLRLTKKTRNENAYAPS
jgi:hypothetical protein